jgi:cyanophycinase-like exopeptidase
MEGTVTDQHLVRRDRIGRTFAFVARLIRDGRARRVLAVAVDEKTAVLVDRKGLARTVGASAAYFILGDHPPETCEPGKPLTYSDFKIWKVTPGGTFDLRRRPKTGHYLVSVHQGKLSRDPY